MLQVQDLYDAPTALQALLHGVQDRFIHFETTNQENKLTKLAFFYRDSLALLALYPDVLIIDTTHNTNRYRMPLVQVVSSAANNETIYVSGAFI